MKHSIQDDAMINSYLANNTPTQCKAHYGEHYHLANRKNHTKDTYGEAITTSMEIAVNKDEYGFYECELSEDGTPLYSNRTWDKLRLKQALQLHKKVMGLSPEFQERLTKIKGLLKRNARRKANKVARKGYIASDKTSRTRHKRELPIPPSQRQGV